jgi:hypothetical protein
VRVRVRVRARNRGRVRVRVRVTFGAELLEGSHDDAAPLGVVLVRVRGRVGARVRG